MKSIFSAVLVLATIALQGQSSPYFCAQAKLAQQQPQTLQIADPDENKYDVKYQKLDIAMTNNSAAVSGTATTIAQVTQAPFTRFVCELLGMQVSTVKINGQTVSFVNNGTTVSANLTNALNLGDLFTVEITYSGTAQEGIIVNTSQLYGFTVAASLSESYSADGWWPSKQVLTDKIDSSDVWVTVASNLKAGSNGLLENITPMPNNKMRYEWKSRYPIDYYLISVAVADYQEYNVYAHPAGLADSILVQNYIYDTPLALSNNQAKLDSTANLIEFFSDIYGLYPFYKEKYGHCQAPIGGGMEHQTMTTIYRFDFGIVAHELGHQWFGDNVTCASWAHIWVNEGFANYSEYLALEHFRPGQERPYMDELHSYVIPDLATTGTAYCDDTTDENRIFDYAMTYAKGAAIIHSLRFEVNNDSLFFAGLKLYQQQNAFGTGTDETVKNVFEGITGQDFTDFFNQWYYGTGYPGFNIEWNQTGGQTYLQVTETQSAPNLTPFFKTSLELTLSSGQGDTTVRVFIDQPTELFTFNWNNPLSSISIDPNQWILNTDGSITQNTALVGLNEQLAGSINLYPNPASNMVALSSNNAMRNITLYDMTGRFITSYAVGNQPVFSFDASALSNGMYIAQIETTTGGIARKLFTKE